MKCPKCGYTSFESYDSCRKCAADLTEFKNTHGLVALVLPPSLRSSMAVGLDAGQPDSDTSSENAGDMFSFDLPTDQQATVDSPPAASDPFSFDDTPTVATPAFSFDTPAVTQQSDPFAALLETAPQLQPELTTQTPPAQGFEMNSFSWDDTPTPGQPGSEPAEPAKSEDDDFNSLFGDLGGSGKK
jgi:hypothetical protein